jgi:hypothetical protein
MNSIGVDPAYSDTKNKKTTITRTMKVRVSDDIAYLDVEFTSDEEEVNSMRTCISSFVANLSLVCETMQAFGN